MSSHYTPVIAGALAYACYILADLRAYAPFPQFLRDHLFDGLAPAALVGILVDLYPEDLTTDAFSKIRRPFMIALMLFVSGAVIFGLIAVAAVFGTGENKYGYPTLDVALTGGFIFSWAYIQQIIANRDSSRRKNSS